MPQRTAMHERSVGGCGSACDAQGQHLGHVAQTPPRPPRKRKAGGGCVALRAGGRACATRTVTFSPGCSRVPNISHGSFRASGPSSSCARRQKTPHHAADIWTIRLLAACSTVWSSTELSTM
jgi:hypothetical protein